MENSERESLEKEWLALSEKMKGEFINPKDLRRSEEITSLLITDGTNANIELKFVKGRGGNKGMSITKPYNRKGKVG